MTTPADADLAIEVLKALPTLLVTLFLGSLTVRVAQEQKRISAQQRDIARRNLNISLFEHRIAVFAATRAAASLPFNTQDPCHAPASMTNLYPDAFFLFGPKVEAYMQEIGRHLNELGDIRADTQRRNGYVAPEAVTRQADLMTWLGHAASTGVRDTFSRYLDFADIR